MARLLSRVRFEEEEVPPSFARASWSRSDARLASSRRSQSAVASKSRKGPLATGLSALGDAIFKESFMSRKRLALLGAVAVVVVAGVAFLVLSDNFPPGSGLTGAIGGVEKAERYRDAQVTARTSRSYDEDGYDQDGFDRDGLDRSGHPKVGRQGRSTVAAINVGQRWRGQRRSTVARSTAARSTAARSTVASVDGGASTAARNVGGGGAVDGGAITSATVARRRRRWRRSTVARSTAAAASTAASVNGGGSVDGGDGQRRRRSTAARSTAARSTATRQRRRGQRWRQRRWRQRHRPGRRQGLATTKAPRSSGDSPRPPACLKQTEAKIRGRCRARHLPLVLSELRSLDAPEYLCSGPLPCSASSMLAHGLAARADEPACARSSNPTTADRLSGGAVRVSWCRTSPPASRNSLAVPSPALRLGASREADHLPARLQGLRVRLANTVPRNCINLGLSPMNFTYETLPAIDRYYWLANHEVAHLATMDQAAGGDLAWRKFFAGKVAPNAEDPHLHRLQLPHQPALELAALVPRGHRRLPRDLDGRRHRPRSRRLRRDGVPLHGARRRLLLRRRRPRVRGHHDRLPDRRQLVPLRHAVHELSGVHPRPREGDRVDRAAAGVEGLLREPVQARLRRAAGRGVAALDRVRARVAEHEPRRRSARTRPPSTATSRRPRWARSRAPSSTRSAARRTSAVHYPGPGRPPRRARPRRPARSRRSPSSRGRRSTTSPRSRSIPSTARSSTHLRQLRVARPLVARPRHRQAEADRRTTSGSVTWRSTAPIGRCGGSSAWTGTRSCCGSPSLRELGADPRLPVRHRSLRPRRVARRQPRSPAAWPRSTARRAWSLYRIDDLVAGKIAPEKLFDFDESLAAELHVLARRQVALRVVVLLGRLERVPLRPRAARDVRPHQRRDRATSGRSRCRTTSCFALRYSGKGFVPVAIPNQEIEKVSAIRFLGDGARREAAAWSRSGPPGSPRDADFAGCDAEGVPVARATCSSSRSTRSSRGYKDSARRRSAASTCRTPPGQSLAQDRRSLLARRGARERREATTSTSSCDYWRWKFRGTWNRDDFYDLFGPTKNSRRGYSLGLRVERHPGLRRSAVLADRDRGRATGAISRPCPAIQEIDGAVQRSSPPLGAARVRLRAQVAGRGVDEEKGAGFASRGATRLGRTRT